MVKNKFNKSPKKLKTSRKWIPLDEFLQKKEPDIDSSNHTTSYTNDYYQPKTPSKYSADKFKQKFDNGFSNEWSYPVKDYCISYSDFGSADSFPNFGSLTALVSADFYSNDYLSPMELPQTNSLSTNFPIRKTQSLPGLQKLQKTTTNKPIKLAASDKAVNYNFRHFSTFDIEGLFLSSNNSIASSPRSPYSDIDFSAISPISSTGEHNDKNHRLKKIKHQLSYYFSISNLCKDLYLRRLIDSNGNIKLSELLKFNRLKSLTKNGKDLNLLTDVIHDNQSFLGLELVNNDTAVRLHNWKQWVL